MLAEQDQHYMQVAISLARQAASHHEVPVGAIVVYQHTIIGRGHNAPISQVDPTAHAEIQAIRAAAQMLDNYRLVGCTLYVTLEPCVMCMGAILQARIARVVFGAKDPKIGACGSVINLPKFELLNHHTRDVVGGVESDTSAELLGQFFRTKRTPTPR